MSVQDHVQGGREGLGGGEEAEANQDIFSKEKKLFLIKGGKFQKIASIILHKS